MATYHLGEVPAVAMLAEHDLQQARTFWRDTLGLEEVYYDEKYREAGYRAGRTVFGVYEHTGGSKADHTQLAFQVDDVPMWVNALRQQGIRFEEYDFPGLKTRDGIADMGDGEQGAWFKDPGGNIIGLFTASRRLVNLFAAPGAMAGAGMTR